MQSYFVLKHIHITAVALSAMGFIWRGALVLYGSALAQSRMARIAPHVVDSVLLASAIGMMLIGGRYPFAEDWLTVKVFGLFAYIVLGSMALKRAPSMRLKRVCFVLALLTLGHIVAAAVTKHPMPVLLLF